jgi:hypothetical protein
VAENVVILAAADVVVVVVAADVINVVVAAAIDVDFWFNSLSSHPTVNFLR